MKHQLTNNYILIVHTISGQSITKQTLMVIALLILWPGLFAQNNSVSAQPEIPLRFGFMPETFSEVSVADTKVAIEVYMAKIFQNTQFVPKAIIFQNVEDLKQALSHHTIDMVTLTALDYVQNSFDSILKPAIVSVSPDNTVLDTYILLCHKNKKWSDLSNLRNAHLQFSKTDQLVSIWLDVQLAQSGYPKSKDFLSKKTLTETPAQAILSVFFGQADACIIDTRIFRAMSELNPQIATTLLPLAQSPGLLFRFFAFHKATPNAIIQEVQDNAVKLAETTDGQKILRIFKIYKLIKYHPQYIKSIHNLVKDYNHYYETEN